MKSNLPIMLLLMLETTAAMAQNTEKTLPTDTSASGLRIESRTEEERVQFLLRVAGAYVKEKDYTSAISAYERILKIQPESREARYMVSYVFIQAHEYARAEQLLKQLIAEYPNDYGHLNNLAWLYATAEDPAYRNGEKAVKWAQEAMVLAPKNHQVWSTLAEAHYVNGEYEKACRATTQMYNLATLKESQLTREEVDNYDDQIRKCQRAMQMQKEMEKDSESEIDTQTIGETSPTPSR